MPRATIPKKRAIIRICKIRLRIIASGRLKAVTAIINANAVPIAIPLAVSASTIGIIPAALEYIGIPSTTATITAKGLSFPV